MNQLHPDKISVGPNIQQTGPEGQRQSVVQDIVQSKFKEVFKECFGVIGAKQTFSKNIRINPNTVYKLCRNCKHQVMCKCSQCMEYFKCAGI